MGEAIEAACGTAVDETAKLKVETVQTLGKAECDKYSHNATKAFCTTTLATKEASLTALAAQWKATCTTTVNANATTIQPLVNSTALDNAVEAFLNTPSEAGTGTVSGMEAQLDAGVAQLVKELKTETDAWLKANPQTSRRL